jgi:hypothetical protein
MKQYMFKSMLTFLGQRFNSIKLETDESPLNIGFEQVKDANGIETIFPDDFSCFKVQILYNDNQVYATIDFESRQVESEHEDIKEDISNLLKYFFAINDASTCSHAPTQSHCHSH